jgi:hypothetical protein
VSLRACGESSARTEAAAAEARFYNRVRRIGDVPSMCQPTDAQTTIEGLERGGSVPVISSGHCDLLKPVISASLAVFSVIPIENCNPLKMLGRAKSPKVLTSVHLPA